MMHHRLYRTIVARAFAAVLTVAAANAFGQGGQPVTLEMLLARIDEHPELEMKRAQIEAAEARIPMRSSLMEPNLILGVQNVPTNFSFNEDPMTAKVIGVGQMFPYPGKLAKERTIGELAVDAARAGLEESRITFRRDVKLSWYDILHKQRSIDVNLQHVRFLEDFKKEIAVNVAYGKASLPQLDQLELEQTELEQMIAEDSSMIAMQRARLQYITGIETSQLEQRDSLKLQPIGYSLEALVSEAGQRNPQLLRLRAEIAQADAAIERAKLERYPDFDVMLMYMMRDDLAAVSGAHGATSTQQMNMFSAQVSITLPFINYGGSKDAMVAEMESMRTMKLAEERHAQREIRMMLAEKLARLEELRRKHDLFTSSVIPSMQTRIQSYIAEYQFDKTSLQTAITQIINLLHKQHEVLELESAYQQTIAEIEAVVGADILTSGRK